MKAFSEQGRNTGVPGKKEKCNMLINCTNHPYEIWNTAQQEAAGRFGSVVDLPFPQIDPHSTPDELCRLAKRVADRIEALQPDAVLVAGEFTFTFILVDKLLKDGVRVLCTCSQRMTQEFLNPDGTNEKRTVFVFDCFREYTHYEEEPK